MSSDSLIGLLCEEFKMQVTRANNGNNNGTNGSVNLAKDQKAPGAGKSLEAHISDQKSKLCSYCKHCKRAGHWTSKCRKLEKNKCRNCGKPGHYARDCWAEKKNRDNDSGKKINGNGKGQRTEDLNMGEEETAFVV
jgi:Zinc knuckle